MRVRFPAPALALALAAPLQAQQQDFSKVEVKAEKVAEGVYMLTGAGGNIGLSIGKSGSLVIDDQYAPLSDKILAAIKTLTPDPVRFVVNTHWHGDHTGGNENLAQDGRLPGRPRERAQAHGQRAVHRAFNQKVPPSPEAALPVVTFAEGVTSTGTATRSAPSTWRPRTPTATRSCSS
jgi:glyoxylase-like metal-dependent hydrolase (beta-lactamase superfamily II)